MISNEVTVAFAEHCHGGLPWAMLWEQCTNSDAKIDLLYHPCGYSPCAHLAALLARVFIKHQRSENPPATAWNFLAKFCSL